MKSSLSCFACEAVKQALRDFTWLKEHMLYSVTTIKLESKIKIFEKQFHITKSNRYDNYEQWAYEEITLGFKIIGNN